MRSYLESTKKNNYRNTANNVGCSYAFFDNLHRFCLDAALVSKIIWPLHSKNKKIEQSRQKRGTQLRKILHLSEDNTIRDRTLRDSIEHFDERLDQWALKTDSAFLIVDRGFFDDYDKSYGFDGTTLPKEMIFRAFNLKTHSYIFMGVEYDIALMSKDLIIIQKSVEHYTRGNETELASIWIEM
jgi:hypothetical protein